MILDQKHSTQGFNSPHLHHKDRNEVGSGIKVHPTTYGSPVFMMGVNWVRLGVYREEVDHRAEAP